MSVVGGQKEWTRTRNFGPGPETLDPDPKLWTQTCQKFKMDPVDPGPDTHCLRLYRQLLDQHQQISRIVLTILKTAHFSATRQNLFS